MKILWVTNIPFDKLLSLLGKKDENTSGSWLNAALNNFKNDNQFELTIVTTGNIKQITTSTDKNINYCILPRNTSSYYNHKNKKNRKNWMMIKEMFEPDIIQIWGTEFTHGYLALQVFKNIPSVIYMQGLLKSIARYYLSGMSPKELRESITIRDILKLDWIRLSQKNFERRSITEAKMINISNNVIVENTWCASHCRTINPNIKIHFSNLNIRKEFFNCDWTVEKMQPKTIMCNAAGYPIKGLHILLKAFNIVLKRFPKAILMIPGETSPFEKNLIGKLKINGYTKFIKKLIIKFNIKNNVCFLGRLSSSLMAEQMSVANVFVLPSSIENHSSTLLEAMVVGTPCISANVGGIPEYLIHNRNGLLYRFEEYELLAVYICQLFENKEKAVFLSENAKKDIRNTRNSNDLKKQLINIYNKILEEK